MRHLGLPACPSCICRQTSSFLSGLRTRSGNVPCRLHLQVASPGPTFSVRSAKTSRMHCVPCILLLQSFVVGDMFASTSRQKLACGGFPCSRILCLRWAHSWFSARVPAEVPSVRSGISALPFPACAPCKVSQMVQHLHLRASVDAQSFRLHSATLYCVASSPCWLAMPPYLWTILWISCGHVCLSNPPMMILEHLSMGAELSVCQTGVFRNPRTCCGLCVTSCSPFVVHIPFHHVFGTILAIQSEIRFSVRRRLLSSVRLLHSSF